MGSRHWLLAWRHHHSGLQLGVGRGSVPIHILAHDLCWRRRVHGLASLQCLPNGERGAHPLDGEWYKMRMGARRREGMPAAKQNMHCPHPLTLSTRASWQVAQGPQKYTTRQSLQGASLRPARRRSVRRTGATRPEAHTAAIAIPSRPHNPSAGGGGRLTAAAGFQKVLVQLVAQHLPHCNQRMQLPPCPSGRAAHSHAPMHMQQNMQHGFSSSIMPRSSAFLSNRKHGSRPCLQMSWSEKQPCRQRCASGGGGVRLADHIRCHAAPAAYTAAQVALSTAGFYTAWAGTHAEARGPVGKLAVFGHQPLVLL